MRVGFLEWRNGSKYSKNPVYHAPISTNTLPVTPFTSSVVVFHTFTRGVNQHRDINSSTGSRDVGKS